eukprot:14115146-Alexandrium_andersonii.AAC.1
MHTPAAAPLKPQHPSAQERRQPATTPLKPPAPQEFTQPATTPLKPQQHKSQERKQTRKHSRKTRGAERNEGAKRTR